MPRGKYRRKFTERECKKCGEMFMGRVRACVCDNCKYVCPDCGGPKKWRSGTWCYPCSLKHRDMTQAKISVKKAIEAARSPEACRARSRALMGHVVSEKTRKKISDAAQGQPWRVEVGKRLGLSSKGKKKSDDWKRQARERFLGSKNPMWKNGSSSEIYSEGWTEDLKERIRTRDNRLCRACGKDESANGRRLDIHHVDGTKTNHSEDNLIALCHSCHQLITTNSKTLEELLS